jgi:hypothetical protein
MKIEIIEILHRPVTSVKNVDILGETFKYIDCSPKVYVVKTNSLIDNGSYEELSFEHSGIEFLLKDVKSTLNKERFFLSCDSFIETYIDTKQ